MSKATPPSFAGPELLFGANACRQMLHEAGFTTKINLQAANGVLVKVLVRWGDKPLGYLCVHKTREGLKLSLHEIAVPAYREAIEEACSGDPARARQKAEAAAVASDPSAYGFHAYVAVVGSPSDACFGVVVERKGERVSESSGFVDGSMQEAEATGAVRFIEHCGDLEIDHAAVHASLFVVNVATGAFKATKPVTKALAAAAEGAPGLLWVVSDGEEPGIVQARRLAEEAYHDACYNGERLDVPFKRAA